VGGQVVGIDDLVGAHGGVGGMQTQPFLIYPAAWTKHAPDLAGAAAAHRFLRRHALGETAGDEEPSWCPVSSRVGSSHSDR
jgi:hypothetical protein